MFYSLSGLLSEIVFSCPVLLLESQAKVREVFDCLPMLPPDTAQGLLVALLPLLKISMSLRDAVMLLLRKSIFSRHVDLDKVAEYRIIFINIFNSSYADGQGK